VLKENANIKIIVYGACQLLAYAAAGNTLPVDKSYLHLSRIKMQ